MITAASNFYNAYLVAEEFPFEIREDRGPYVISTTDYFNKVFMRCGEYGLEFDLDADPERDATGLGRVHREGAPSAICLSVPCPKRPLYKVDIEEPVPLALSSVRFSSLDMMLGADEGACYELLDSSSDDGSARATFLCRFADGGTTTEKYTVNDGGVLVLVTGEGRVGYSLPVFSFDGEASPEISAAENTLSVSYNGWACKYTADGKIFDSGKIGANRNGHYRLFVAEGKDILNVKIEIVKE